MGNPKYHQAWNQLIEEFDKYPLDAVSRCGLVQFTNMRYGNDAWYSKHERNPFRLDVEENVLYDDMHLKNVIELCLHTEVYKKLGLTLLDLLNLDVPTFTVIREALTKDITRKTERLEKEAREQDRRQQEILNRTR